MDALKLKLIKKHSEDLHEISTFEMAFSFACTLERNNKFNDALKYYNRALDLAIESEHVDLCKYKIDNINEKMCLRK